MVARFGRRDPLGGGAGGRAALADGTPKAPRASAGASAAASDPAVCFQALAQEVGAGEAQVAHQQ
eukprot:6872072-Prymnesium_polylepis.1